MDPYSIIVKPHLTEKSMNAIDQNNELTFKVLRTARKSQIKSAFEELFAVKVERVTAVAPLSIWVTNTSWVPPRVLS